MEELAFQDAPYMAGNCCLGCSPGHPNGLQIKSFWDGEDSVCDWQPGPEHTAGWPNVLYGGTMASLIDCHCVCTAIAAAHRQVGTNPVPTWFATVSLQVDYLKPTPLDQPVQLRARLAEFTGKKAVITCSVFSGGEECARGTVTAVRVPAKAGPGQ